MLSLFSPRDNKDTVETLHWYADIMSKASRVMCMTFAFNLDKLFQDVLEQPGQALRYAVFDKALDLTVEAKIEATKNTVIAAGAELSAGRPGEFHRGEAHGFQSELLHPRQVHADRSPGG